MVDLIQNDDKLAKLYKSCLIGTPPSSNYTIQHGLLFFRNKIFLPANLELLNQIMQEFHASKLGGHARVNKTIARIASQFHWVGMRKDIMRFVKECVICQQAKVDHLLPTGLLQPLPIPQQIWEDLAIDFIVALPLSQGYSIIFVVIDRLSKFGYFIPLKSGFTSKVVADVFISNIVKVHGMPKTIVSDKDRVFIATFWQNLFKAQGMTSSYHPQSDGQTENLNKTLEMYLRCFIFYNPKKWVSMLPWAQFWYNTSFHQHDPISSSFW